MKSFDFSCPVCECRLTASIDQVGQTIICPDCLESVFVPQPPAPHTPAPPDNASRTSSPTSSGTGRGADSDSIIDLADTDEYRLAEDEVDDDEYRLAEDDDELKLAPLEPGPGVEQYVTDRNVDVDLLRSGTPGSGPPEAPPPSRPSPGRPPVRRFGITCHVCDSRLDVCESDVGTTVKCPDCGTDILVQAPRAEQVHTVTLDDLDGDDFKLAEAAPVPVYQEMVQEAEQRVLAEEEERKKKGHVAVPRRLPARPLIDGVFNIFKCPSAWAILVILAAMIYGQSSLVTMTNDITTKEGANPLIVVGMSILSIVVSLVTILFGAAMLLKVVEDTNDGYDEVREFVSFFSFEWVGDGFPVLLALAVSLLPAALLSQISCMPSEAAIVFSVVCAWLFFPFILLSMLEGASWTALYSPVIAKTYVEHRKKWMHFYVETAILAIVSLPLFFVRLPLMWLWIPSLLTAVAALLYFRLLGRLLRWTAMAPPETPAAPHEQLPDQPAD